MNKNIRAFDKNKNHLQIKKTFYNLKLDTLWERHFKKKKKGNQKKEKKEKRKKEKKKKEKRKRKKRKEKKKK